jgi:hypothetical protein
MNTRLLMFNKLQKRPAAAASAVLDLLKDELWLSSGQVSRKPQQEPRL